MKARAVLFLALVSACGDAPDPSWLVTRLRPIGARVEVLSEPLRASPRAGEAFEVKWRFVGSDLPLAYMFVLCQPVDAMREVACAEPPIESVAGRGELTIRGTAPAAPRVLLLGMVCEEGTPRLSPTGAYGWCEGTARLGSHVSLEIDVGSENKNPRIGDDRIRLDGATWAKVPEPITSCDGLPMVSSGEEKHALEVVIAGDDREPMPFAGRETMVLSQLVTAGKLDHQFSVLESNAAPGDAPLADEWKSPRADELTADPMIARFYFVLRDSMGGTDFATRAVCVRRGK